MVGVFGVMSGCNIFGFIFWGGDFMGVGGVVVMILFCVDVVCMC